MGMPAKRMIDDGIAAPRTWKRRRHDQFIDHRSARATVGETGRKQDAVCGQNAIVAEPDLDAVRVILESGDLTFVPVNSLTGNRTADRTGHVRRDGSPVSCRGDHGSASIVIGFMVEKRRVLRTQPARIAVELMFSQGMSRHEVDPMPFPDETERDMSGRDPPTDHQNRLGR